MSKKKIAIIDYGMGNVGSIANALDYLNGRYLITGDKNELDKSDAVILPGVGAFAAAMENLKNMDMLDSLENEILTNKKPFLGICLGMHLLARDSMEGGYHQGLGWIDGHVKELQPKGKLRVPHVGWNNVDFTNRSILYKNIDGNTHFYFDHSFHFECEERLIKSTYEYGNTYIASIQKKNIFATQFHPEKSQRIGLKLLRNFLNFVEDN